ncbi:hypothetical protein D0Y65_034298 [Glycine soja]|uniref:Uncharacterized protein n=1 Tax=Glycine soja TaxID=3848 RepID=A0A445HQ90_GLYSO|nr:hypothetical protein D0Y65_034298 [Glycine soja]
MILYTITYNNIQNVNFDYRQISTSRVLYFWFPPGKGSTVKYRSASRLGNFDFDVNRKRIKALRQELEKKGWTSQDTI